MLFLYGQPQGWPIIYLIQFASLEQQQSEPTIWPLTSLAARNITVASAPAAMPLPLPTMCAFPYHYLGKLKSRRDRRNDIG